MLDFQTSDLEDLIESIEHDSNLIRNIIQDSSFIDQLTDLVAENFDRVFATEGSNIGEDWNGNTLVKTGTLKLSLTSPSSLSVQVFGDSVTFSSTVFYAGYVNDMYTFTGVDSQFDADLSNLVTDFLKQNGKLDWR